MSKTPLSDILYEQMRVDLELNKLARESDEIKFYPSDIGKCSRAVVYRMLGREPLPPEPRLQAILENGTFFHNRIEEIFERSGVLIAAELPIKIPELKVSGRSDAVIRNTMEHVSSDTIIQLYKYDKEKDERVQIWEGPDNDVHLIEFKSINNNGFNNYIKTKPKQDHVDQLLFYLWALKMKVGSVLYENKNDQMMKEFLVDYDENRIHRFIIPKIKKCVKHSEQGTLPSREAEENSFDCRYCSFAHICRPKSYYKTKIIDMSQVLSPG